jgi:hypothetical protein
MRGRKIRNEELGMNVAAQKLYSVAADEQAHPVFMHIF